MMKKANYYEMATIKSTGRGAVQYLSNKKGYLPIYDPPLLNECTDLGQFIANPLQLNYPNHTQSVERAVKLTTEATSRLSGQKRQIGEAMCSLAGRKNGYARRGGCRERLLQKQHSFRNWW